MADLKFTPPLEQPPRPRLIRQGGILGGTIIVDTIAMRDDETPAQFADRIRKEERARLVYGLLLILIGFGIGWLVRGVFP